VPSAPAACDLITQQEATSALGFDPGHGFHWLTGGVWTPCRWGPEQAFTKVSYIAIGAEKFADSASASIAFRKAHADYLRMFDAGVVTDVAAAEEAVMIAEDRAIGPSAQIIFKSGSRIVRIELVSIGASAPQRDAVKVLADAALGRLPNSLN
jgi:hypothetical protein